MPKKKENSLCKACRLKCGRIHTILAIVNFPNSPNGNSNPVSEPRDPPKGAQTKPPLSISEEICKRRRNRRSAYCVPSSHRRQHHRISRSRVPPREQSIRRVHAGFDIEGQLAVDEPRIHAAADTGQELVRVALPGLGQVRFENSGAGAALSAKEIFISAGGEPQWWRDWVRKREERPWDLP